MYNYRFYSTVADYRSSYIYRNSSGRLVTVVTMAANTIEQRPKFYLYLDIDHQLVTAPAITAFDSEIGAKAIEQSPRFYEWPDLRLAQVGRYETYGVLQRDRFLGIGPFLMEYYEIENYLPAKG